MDFFEHQVRTSKHRPADGPLFLGVILTIASVYGIVAVIFLQDRGFFDPQVMLITSAVTIGLVAIGSLYKSFALRQGGEAVALLLGGRRIPSDTTDQQEKRLLNIVEEMAIASGTPVRPSLSWTPKKGSTPLPQASRPATPSSRSIGERSTSSTAMNCKESSPTEFSHILNGDMRLNLRLIGWLHGLLMIF